MQEIVSHPDVMCGKPVIAGTRITVEHILTCLAAGQSIERLMEDYPDLTREGVAAALEYARESVKMERLMRIAS